MHLLRILALSTAFPFIALCDANSHTATVWCWPIASSSPAPLAQVSYNTYDHSTSVTSYTPPKIPFNADDIVRVGLYDKKAYSWKGVVTSAASFNSSYQQYLTLHVGHDGELVHVGFDAQDKPDTPKKGKKAQQEDSPQIVARLVKPTPGPTPHLNKPVVLSPDGKYQDKETEKTFLQKYWWIILAVVLFQLVMAGGGSEK